MMKQRDLLIYWVTFISSIKKHLWSPCYLWGIMVGPVWLTKWVKRRHFEQRAYSGTLHFSTFSLLPCNAWQMTFLLLIHSHGHTQGYPHAVRVSHIGMEITLNPFLCVKRNKNQASLKTFPLSSQLGGTERAMTPQGNRETQLHQPECQGTLVKWDDWSESKSREGPQERGLTSRWENKVSLLHNEPRQASSILWDERGICDTQSVLLNETRD
jgi:hypothetical protein